MKIITLTAVEGMKIVKVELIKSMVVIEVKQFH